MFEKKGLTSLNATEVNLNEVIKAVKI